MSVNADVKFSRVKVILVSSAPDLLMLVTVGASLTGVTTRLTVALVVA